MEEFFSDFQNSFWKMASKELNDVSIGKLIICILMGAILIHVLCLVYARLRGTSINPDKETVFILLVGYIIFIAYITIIGRTPGRWRVFMTKSLSIDADMDQNVTNVLNFCFFIPYGVLVTIIQNTPILWKRILMTVSYSFLGSLTIEIIQYITKRGYFEIDDLETNVLGGILGALIVVLVLWIKRKKHNDDIDE